MQGTAVRSLDIPVTFSVRGTSSGTSATLLQLALGGCRIRTWRIMGAGECVTIALPGSTGGTLQIAGRVREAKRFDVTLWEYSIALDPMPEYQEDIVAREAALLVRRRRNAA